MGDDGQDAMDVRDVGGDEAREAAVRAAATAIRERRAPEGDAGVVAEAVKLVMAEGADFSVESTDAPRALKGVGNVARRAGLADRQPLFAAWVACRLASRLRDAVELTYGDDDDAEAVAAIGLVNAPRRPIDGVPDFSGPIVEVVGEDGGTLLTIGVSIAGDETPGRGPALAALARLAEAPVVAGPEGAAAVDGAVALAKVPAPGAPDVTFVEDAPAPEDVSHVFDAWTPRYVTFGGMRPHPAELIEAKTLASIAPTAGERVVPLVPDRAVRSGQLSDAQLEAVTLAVNAFGARVTVDVADEPLSLRAGFLLADGPGTGKTNTIAGIVADGWARGARRHVVVIEKRGHQKHFRRAFGRVCPGVALHLYQDVAAADSVTVTSGVVLVTYATLRRTAGRAMPTVEALRRWMLAGKGEGCLVFDESQNLRNTADAVSWSRGSSTASDQARAGLALANGLPDARVVYSSATGATDINNLAYMNRLGLWGAETAYASFDRFMRNQRHAGALESIPIHLKSVGRMVSRTLSLSGVRYDVLVHRLDLAQEETYQEVTKLVELTYRLTDAITTAMTHRREGSPSLKAVGVVDHPLWSPNANLLALTRSVLGNVIGAFDGSMTMKTVLLAADAAIEAGKSPVFQVSRTHEAETRRQMAFGERASGGSFTMIPIDLLRTVVRKAVETGVARGSKVVVPEMLDVVDELVARWEALPRILSPLDQIIERYGPSRVAEVTGRRHRRVPVSEANLSRGFVVEERGDEDALLDHAAFLSGEKTIAVLSLDFAGSGYDFHAGRDFGNRRRRWHCVVETGQQADVAVQGLGRTHRNNQESEPEVLLSTSEVPSSMVGSSRVVRNIQRLGALSLGNREAWASGILDAIGDYDSPAAQLALTNVMRKVASRAYDDLSPEAMEYHRLVTGRQVGNTHFASSTLKFMKRLALCDLGYQRAFMGRFRQEYEALGRTATSGLSEDGPYLMRDPFEITSTECVYEDAATRERVLAHAIRGVANRVYLGYEEALLEAQHFAMPNEPVRFRFRKTDGNLMMQAKFDEEDPRDPFDACWRVYTPEGVQVMDGFRRSMMGGVEPAEADRRRLWDEHVARLRTYEQRSKILVTGSILRIAPLLERDGASQRLVVATTTDGRQMSGYLVTEEGLGRIRMDAPELRRVVGEREAADARSRVEAGTTLVLDNKWRVAKQYVPEEMIPKLGEGERDDDDCYLAVTLDVDDVTAGARIWLGRNGWREVTAASLLTSEAVYARRYADGEEGVGALLGITSVVGIA